jgi:Mn2+/Fe2+ NRAMP family transporter
MMARKHPPGKDRYGEENGRLKRAFAILGPGLITGAADDDPSGISTYSVAGAAYGYATLWIALLTFPLMVAIQLMCARLGMVTGRGLAAAASSRGLVFQAVADLPLKKCRSSITIPITSTT